MSGAGSGKEDKDKKSKSRRFSTALGKLTESASTKAAAAVQFAAKELAKQTEVTQKFATETARRAAETVMQKTGEAKTALKSAREARSRGHSSSTAAGVGTHASSVPTQSPIKLEIVQNFITPVLIEHIGKIIACYPFYLANVDDISDAYDEADKYLSDRRTAFQMAFAELDTDVETREVTDEVLYKLAIISTYKTKLAEEAATSRGEPFDFDSSRQEILRNELAGLALETREPPLLFSRSKTGTIMPLTVEQQKLDKLAEIFYFTEESNGTLESTIERIASNIYDATNHSITMPEDTANIQDQLNLGRKLRTTTQALVLMLEDSLKRQGLQCSTVYLADGVAWAVYPADQADEFEHSLASFIDDAEDYEPDRIIWDAINNGQNIITDALNNDAAMQRTTLDLALQTMLLHEKEVRAQSAPRVLPTIQSTKDINFWVKLFAKIVEHIDGLPNYSHAYELHINKDEYNRNMKSNDSELWQIKSKLQSVIDKNRGLKLSAQKSTLVFDKSLPLISANQLLFEELMLSKKDPLVLDLMIILKLIAAQFDNANSIDLGKNPTVECTLHCGIEIDKKTSWQKIICQYISAVYARDSATPADLFQEESPEPSSPRAGI